MDLKQLRAVVTVAEVGNVTRAAELLYLVQPAVTRQIRSLEQELGVALFERTSRGMTPTENGARFIERARRALGEVERARAELQRDRDQLTGIVTVGVLGAATDIVVKPLLEEITAQFPGIDLRLATAYSGHLEQWLDSGELDISMVYNLNHSRAVHVRPLLRDSLWAVAPKEAGLRPEHPVDLRYVLGQPFVMPIAGQHGLRLLLDQARVGLDVAPRITVQANSMTLQKLLVSEGYGWTVLPAPGVARDVELGDLSAAPVQNPSIPRTIAIATARTGRTSPAVEAVAAALVRVMRASVNGGRWPSATWLDDAEP